jgi:putative ATPase
VLKLNTLDEDELALILERALSEDGIMKEMELSFGEGVRDGLLGLAGGDARRLLNILETASVISKDGVITADVLQEAYDRSTVYYDRAGDRHYDTISAFIKSMRGSDPNAAVYYLARMLIAGEDPEFIARRMVIFASEDIGNAAPQALPFAVSVLTAVKNIGMPEVEIVLSHCATFLASAPKSNASYLAIKRAKEAAADPSFTVPMHIRNAPTGLMKSMGYAKGYRYPHDFPHHFIKEQYLPRGLEEAVYYDPSGEGTEKAVRARLVTLWPEKYPPDKK